MAQTATVSLDSVKQYIRGFGGMSHAAWAGDLNPTDRTIAFNNGTGQLGFSILRIPVSDGNPDSANVATAKAAVAAGALVFATPWNAYHVYTSADFPSYLTHLNNFVSYMAGQGVKLYSISVQNEPDWGTTAKAWGSWTPAACHDFILNYGAQVTGAKLMSCESFSYNKTYYDPVLNDPAALANVGVFGTHIYGTAVNAYAYPLWNSNGGGREMWMTEHYTDSTTDANSWPNALGVATEIHNVLVTGQINAYIWWFIKRSYGPIYTNDTISKRGWCMAHWSKFVRPGFHRVDATASPASGLLLSAFKSDSGEVAMVMVNNNTSAASLKITVNGSSIAAYHKYTTSGSKSLADDGTVAVANGALSVSLDAQSVTTLFGPGAGPSSSGTGGSTGTGGVSGTGGATGTGGAGTGGVVGTGGIASTGGVSGTGGIASTGGVVGTGGIVSTGGVTTGGAGGSVAQTGGISGTSGGSSGEAPTNAGCSCESGGQGPSHPTWMCLPLLALLWRRRRRGPGALAWLVCAALITGACANGETTATGAGGSGPEGGSTGSGGAAPGTGGLATGGVTSTGGTGTGGIATTGGVTGTGGLSTGGTSGRGGSGAGGGSAGAPGAGGATGAGGKGSGTCAGASAMTGDVTVTLSSLQQKISGFGVSTAWGSSMSTSDAAMLWSTATGAGLSLHRIRIDYTNGHTSELNIAKMAVGYGVTVWATPWTPPVADKSNNNSVEGTLTNPSAYATFLLGFVSYMKQNGVDIYAVSAQNEPDANVTYESCVYTPATMATWVGGTLGPAFAGSGVKVMAPETQNWCGFTSFEPALMSDANAKKYTDIVATHEYGCTPKAYPDIAAAGKEFWETEIYDSPKSGDNPMSSPLRMAKLINDAMTIANMNAWHYWWVYDKNTGLFTTGGSPTKRLWVEGNYARFVRPGYQRVATTGAAPSGLLVSAYTNPTDGTVAVVAVNNNTTTTPISFYVAGSAPCSLTPWVTDASNDLAGKPAIAVSGGRFTATLGAQSVTTFVGRP